MMQARAPSTAPSDKTVLGIETSCDETAVAVVAAGTRVLAQGVYSQIARHQPYGGVVPDIASRCHVEVLPRLLAEVRSESGLDWTALDAVAVTAGPGLASSLLVGLSAAKALAARLRKPLIGVHHVEAHLYSLFLSAPDAPPVPAPELPALALMVSGGHTALVRMDGVGRYAWLGQSLDDAAGEALDKGANLMKLGYPGGPVIEAAAAGGRPDRYRFPRGRVGADNPLAGTCDSELCFSFSGLKTALLYHLRDHPEALAPDQLPDLAASYQEAVFDALLERVERAIARHPVRTLGCVGGVARNMQLRGKLEALAARYGLATRLAPPAYCTDNAVMIAGLAGASGGPGSSDADRLDVDPTWRLPSR